MFGVEKAVRVPALRGVCNVGQRQIQGKEDDEKYDMQRRWRTSARKEYLEQGEEGVEGMLGYLCARGS